jgi:putative endonuclease
VLGRNVWAGGYELDLVLRRGRTTVFAEVKSKSGDGFGTPVEMVTPEKVARIRRAALAWLERHPAERVRFDVVSVRGRRIEVLQDAF